MKIVTVIPAQAGTQSDNSSFILSFSPTITVLELDLLWSDGEKRADVTNAIFQLPIPIY